MKEQASPPESELESADKPAEEEQPESENLATPRPYDPYDA
jgi:hypothetical protein